MKKLLSLMLCIVFVCFALVSCAEDVIGEYLPNYNVNKTTDDAIETLNFYIICGENTSSEAKVTVPQNINTYIKEKYEIELNIVYCTEAEYNAKVTGAMAKTAESERPDIVLVNSPELYDTLKANLLSLNSLYDSKEFKSINTIIDRSLLDASAEKVGEENIYYTVPNNHVIGSYTYIVIDKAKVRDTLHFNESEINAMVSEESLDELKAAILAYDADADFEDYFQIVSGMYEEKEFLEYGVENRAQLQEKKNASASTVNYVNVISRPSTTREEAFKSAFAIVRHLVDKGEQNSEEEQAVLDAHYSKCMKIIYALNTDVQFKNMLQYGYVNTNYKFNKNEKNENTDYIELINAQDGKTEVAYDMNLIYTGNIFLSYFCEEIGWNEFVFDYYKRQNADAVVPE